MKTLFIDTHSSKLTIAIITDNKTYKIEKGSNRSHSEIAVPCLEEALRTAECTLENINQIIVVNGPGSFTGVRIGVTIAKTIAYSLNIPIKTITSLEAKGVSTLGEFDIISIPDSKGFYSALKKDNTFTDFQYRKDKDFQEYITANKYSLADFKELNFQNILSYLETKDYTNPHQVNPIYIKEIEVLK